MPVRIPVSAVPVAAALKNVDVHWKTRSFHVLYQLIQPSSVAVRVAAVLDVGIDVVGYTTGFPYSRRIAPPHVIRHGIASKVSLLPSRVCEDIRSPGRDHQGLSRARASSIDSPEPPIRN